MNEREFEINGRKFQLNKIDALKQFRIVRRIAPILGELLPAAQRLGQIAKNKVTEEDNLSLIAPIMNGLSKLSDDDANVVLMGLCSSVEVQQAPIGNWARLSTDTQILMQDLELPVLLQAAGRAFMYNLAGFFYSNLQISHGGK